jgi:hypothetical protein
MLPVVRAVDNTVSIVLADVAGEQQGRFALGSSRIIDVDGAVLSAADPQAVGLIVADIEPHSRPFDPRGWDGRTNQAGQSGVRRNAGAWRGNDLNDADKIFTGRVQPQGKDALDAPFANSISPVTDFGYSQRAVSVNRP